MKPKNKHIIVPLVFSIKALKFYTLTYKDFSVQSFSYSMDLTNTIDMKYIKALYISVERVSGYLPIVWNDSWCISRSFLQGIYEKKEVIHLTYIDSKATQQR